MQRYTKAYTRENTLFAIQAWEEHQAHRLATYFGKNAPLSIFDARNGVVSVYYHEKIAEMWQDIIAQKGAENPTVIENLMRLYSSQIDTLEAVWKRGALDSKGELVEFFDFMADMWIGLSVSYCLPDTKNISREFQNLGMELRTRSVDFLDNTDRVIRSTLETLYPELGGLVSFLSVEEIRSDALPSHEELEERKRHYVYFNFAIFTRVSATTVAKENGIEIFEEVVPEGVDEVQGQTAMRGKVTGAVRVLRSKSEISNLIEGEILVTAMTTPDFLPAMQKAAAFVTDEGGITCHAAIVAREMKKPCVIGTKFATQVFKDGDLVEVDADAGTVRVLESVDSVA